MPCSDNGRDNGDRDKMESLLCSTCKVLEEKDFDFGLNPSLDKWWSRHKEADKIREREEATKEIRRRAAIKIAKTKDPDSYTKKEWDLLREFKIIPKG